MFDPIEPPDYADLVRPRVEKAARRERDAVETMCERMLTQDGTDYGVLVETEFDMDACSATTTVTLSPEVPFGQIHYKRGY